MLWVPAHTGGADLSKITLADGTVLDGPRPHGRGGFKCIWGRRVIAGTCVPAHTGGADLSIAYNRQDVVTEQSPPTRAGRI